MSYTTDEVAALVSELLSKMDIVIGSGILSATWDTPVQFASSPDTNEVISFYNVATPFVIKAGMPGAVGSVLTPPVATYVVTLKSGGTAAYNTGTTVGTVTVSTAGVVTFATTGNVDVAIPVGMFKWVAPALDTGITCFAATLKV